MPLGEVTQGRTATKTIDRWNPLSQSNPIDPALPVKDDDDSFPSSGQRSKSMRAFIIAALLASMVASVGLLMPLPGPDRIKNDLADLLHFPSFFALTFVLLRFSKKAFPGRTGVAIAIAVSVIALGAVLEWAQGFFGRSSSMHDLVANTVGGSAATAYELTRQRSKRFRYAVIALGLGGFVFVSYMPVRSLVDLYRELKHPEQVGYFVDPYELHRWYFHAAKPRIRYEADAMGLSNTLCIRFYPDPFPAAQLQHLTRDWTDYRLLRFRIAWAQPVASQSSTADTLKIRTLIRDYRHHKDDQGNKTHAYYETLLTLQPGEYRTVEIPISEIAREHNGMSLYMRNIRFIEFTAVDLQQPVEIELREIELVK